MKKITKAYNIDCMELLKQTPDNYYSLALVDPPYGIGCEIDKDYLEAQEERFKLETSQLDLF